MKKVLTILALMVATVAVVATSYSLTRPAKGSGNTYTGKATSMWNNSNLTEYTDKTVTIVDKANGVCEFTIPGVEIATAGTAINMAKFVIADATVTESDGVETFSFKGLATTTEVNASYGFTEGGTKEVTLEGTRKDGKLNMTLKFSLFGIYEVVYTFGVEDTTEPEPEPEAPEVKGTVVGEDGYAPAGSAFTWTTDIDWNTQKLVASIDVSKCSTYNANILSVGSQISTWSSGSHFHFYYVPETKALKSNFLTNGSNKCRVQESGIVLNSDTLLIEISKETGLTVNGVDFNYYYGGTEQFTDFETVYADLFALTSIEVGSQEGSNRSDAVYNYVRVQNLESDPEPATPVVYNDKAVVNYYGYDYNRESQDVEITETAENTYTVVVKELTISSTKVATYTAEGVTGTTDEEGNVNYSFDGEATLSDVGAAYSSSLSEGGKVPFTMVGSSKDGVLKAQFTSTLMESALVLTFGDYKEPVKPTVYTADATSRWSDGSNEQTGTHTGKTVEVTDNGDGTYTFNVLGTVYMGGENEMSVADFKIENVVMTEGEDGSLSFNYEGPATAANISSNAVEDEPSVTFKGKLKGEDLYFTLSCTIYSMYNYTYTFGKEEVTPEEPEIEGTVIGEDGYQPAGSSFTWTGNIDWASQKLVASIDVTSCTGTNECILSVGNSISAWNGTHFHLYYTRSTNTLQVNYLDASNGNIIRRTATAAGDTLLIEISKANGITVNGESWNYLYDGDETTDMTNYSSLWDLTEIEVGSQEGSTRSNATYNYVRVQDVKVTVTNTESFSEKMTVKEPSTKETTIEDASLDLLTYSDGTYGVALHGVQGEEANLGDITVTGLTAQEEDGDTYYTGEQEMTVNGVTMVVAVAGVKYADGSVWFTVELVTPEEDIYYIEYGQEKNGYGEGKAYAGSWKVSSPAATFNGTVDVIEQGGGKYALRIHDYQLDGNVVPAFVVPDLEGTLEDGKLSISVMKNVPVVYEENTTSIISEDDTKKVTYVEFITVETEGENLTVNFSYVGYGDGANDYVTNATFNSNNGGTDGINAINAAALNGKAEIFTVNGAKVNAMQKGINIVRVNGKAVKVVKK